MENSLLAFSRKKTVIKKSAVIFLWRHFEFSYWGKNSLIELRSAINNLGIIAKRLKHFVINFH